MRCDLPATEVDFVKDRTIALTGGAGFVGSALARAFAKHNRVITLDLGLHGNVSDDPDEAVQFGDVRDYETVAGFVREADIVIHLASIAGVSSVLSHPVATLETAIYGTTNVLRAVRAHPVERVVIFSTSEVAGRFAYKVADDATMNGARVGELRWTYAAAKLAGEFAAAAYHFEHAVPTVCLRPFNIYGPGQLGVGAIRQFARAAVRNEPLIVHGDGSQIRAWCYIDDVVRAVASACIAESAIGTVFNIGDPRSVITVSELAKLIIRLAQSKSEIHYVQADEVDVELRVPNIDRARKVLGFDPRVDLDQGILRTLEWCREEMGAHVA